MKWITTAIVIAMVAAGAVVRADVVTDLRPVIREVAQKHGIDPILMEAIIRHESGNATSSAARKKNNLAGIMGRGGQRAYASKEECVRHLGAILAKYKAKGRITVAQISGAYCRSRGTWIAGVNTFMNRIRAGHWGSANIYEQNRASAIKK